MTTPRASLPSLRAFLGAIALNTSPQTTRRGLALLEGGLAASDIAVRDAVNAIAQATVSISVTEFGAVGNGIADDSPAFQAAFDAAAAQGAGIIVVPPGLYKFLSGVTVRSAVTLTGMHGAPPGGINVQANAFPTLLHSFDGDFITVDYGNLSGVGSSGGGIEGLRLVQGYQSGGGGTPRGRAIVVRTSVATVYPTWLRFRKLTIEDGTSDPWTWGLYLDGGSVSNQFNWIGNCFVSEVHTHINNPAGGALFGNAIGGVIVDACQFHLQGNISLTGNCSLTAVTQAGSGPAVTVSGVPGDAGNPVKNVVVKITTGGTLGVGQYAVSTDGGVTYGAPATLAASAALTNGVTGTFAAGTYVLNTTYAFTAFCFPTTEVSFTGCVAHTLALDKVADIQWTGGDIGTLTTTQNTGRPFGGSVRIDPGLLHTQYSTNVDATFNDHVHVTSFDVNATPEPYERHSRPIAVPNNTVALYGEAVAAAAIGIVKVDTANVIRFDPAGAATYFTFGPVTNNGGINHGDIALPNSVGLRGQKTAGGVTVGLILLDSGNGISIGHDGGPAYYLFGSVATTNSGATGDIYTINGTAIRQVNAAGSDTYGLVEGTPSSNVVRIGRGSGGIRLGAGAADAYNQPTYGPTVTVDATLGNTVHIRATDGSAFTISTPTNPFTSATQTLTFVVFNDSGGALGAVTWDTGYVLASAWTSPANGKRRTITFVYDSYSTKWFEVSRTTADM